MDFSWVRAVEIALVGFSGVFVILIILSIIINITSRVARLIEKKPENEKDR